MSLLKSGGGIFAASARTQASNCSCVASGETSFCSFFSWPSAVHAKTAKVNVVRMVASRMTLPLVRGWYCRPSARYNYARAHSHQQTRTPDLAFEIRDCHDGSRGDRVWEVVLPWCTSVTRFGGTDVEIADWSRKTLRQPIDS